MSNQIARKAIRETVARARMERDMGNLVEAMRLMHDAIDLGADPDDLMPLTDPKAGGTKDERRTRWASIIENHNAARA